MIASTNGSGQIVSALTIFSVARIEEFHEVICSLKLNLEFIRG